MTGGGLVEDLVVLWALMAYKSSLSEFTGFSAQDGLQYGWPLLAYGAGGAICGAFGPLQVVGSLHYIWPASGPVLLE